MVCYATAAHPSFARHIPAIPLMSHEVNSIESFLAVLRKSGLVEAARLEEVASPWKGETGPLPDALPQAFVKAELITEWQLRQLLKGKHRGYFLGRYKLLRELGKGGMSSVYLAEHTGMHLPVAIKVLPLKRVDKKSYKERFEREAQASFRLNHPNIARATNFDHQGDLWYIVLDYIDGTDLYKTVKEQGPLPVKDALNYIRQAALGLQYAHDEGLVHRDIKPANLMLDSRGTIKILDLGLALGATDDDEEGGLTKEHNEKVLGTADYLSPEQSKNSHAADPRSDIYSLGCTLYYLLVGRAPFAKGSVVERIKAHWNEPPPNPLDELDVPPPDLDSAVVDLYFRMLEKHPDARPQSAGEVADTIQAWLDQHASDAPRPAGSLRRRPAGSSDGGSSLLQSASGSLSSLRRRAPEASGSNVLRSGLDADTAPLRRQPETAAKPAQTRPDEREEEEDDDDDFLGSMTPAAGRPAGSQRSAASHADEDDDDEDDDFLYGAGSPAGSADSDDDEDDDFLSMSKPSGDSLAAPADTQLAPAGSPAQSFDDMSVGEWWGSLTSAQFLRVPFWGWVGIVGFLVFCTLLTLTLWSLEAWPFTPATESQPAAAAETASEATD